MAGFPDYHPEHPGGRPDGGRSLECPLFPFDELGEWADRVTVGYQLRGNITMSETPLGRGAPDGVAPAELARRLVHDERGAGQGLVGRLLRAVLDRGIEPQVGMRAVRLVTSDGRVTGVELEAGDGQTRTVLAGKGVILATGGFEWDEELVRSFLRGPHGATCLRSDQHRRRSAHGDADRRRLGQHARGLVGADHRRPSCRPRHRRLAGQR